MGTRDISFTTPSVTVMPDSIVEQGYTVTISVYGLPLVSNASDLNVVLAASPTQVLTPSAIVSSVADGWTEFTVAAPAVGAAGTVSGTVGHTSNPSQNQTFSITYTAVPSAINVVPLTGYTTVTTQISLDLVGFYLSPTRTTSYYDPTSVQCSVSGVQVDTLSVSVKKQSSETRGDLSVVVLAPRAAEISAALVSSTQIFKCVSLGQQQAGTASFEFAYTLAPPVITLNTTSGSHNGGTAVSVSIENFNPVSSAEEFSVSVTSGDDTTTYITDKTLVYSKASDSTSSASTRFTIVTPKSNMGAVELRVASSTQSVSTQYLYADTSVTVPELVGLGSAAQSCVSNTSCALLATGGSSVNVTVTNFAFTDKDSVSVSYNSKQAIVSEFNRGAASTDMTLHFAAAVEAGTYAIEISPSKSSSQTAYVDVTFQSAMAVTSLTFNSFASSVKLGLNHQIGSIEGVQGTTGVFACSAVIADAASKLGANKCTLSTDKTNLMASMQHEAGSTIATGGDISTIIDSLTTANSLSKLGAQTVYATAPGDTAAPKAVITGPTEIDLCQSSAILKGVSSAGAGWLKYSWSGASGSALDTYLRGRSETSDRVQIDSSLLPTSGQSIQACLVVQDLFNQISQQVCHTVTRADIARPTIQIIGQSSVTFTTTRENTIQASAMYSECLSRDSLVYRWTLPSTVPRASYTGAPIALGYRTLVLPAGSLDSGLVNAEFVLEAWQAASPDNVASAKVLVSTSYPELQVTFGDSGGFVNSKAQLNLDASASNDPAGQLVKVSWSCAQAETGLPCRDSSGNLIEASYGPAPATVTPTSAPTPECVCPTVSPSSAPSKSPSLAPTSYPTNTPSFAPSGAPSDAPSNAPTNAPSNAPTSAPTGAPTNSPSFAPTNTPTLGRVSICRTTPYTIAPTNAPSWVPTSTPSDAPSNSPTTFGPTDAGDTYAPSNAPTTYGPSNAPSWVPTSVPTKVPTHPTASPTAAPTTLDPTVAPSNAPTENLEHFGLAYIPADTFPVGKYIWTAEI